MTTYREIFLRAAEIADKRSNGGCYAIGRAVMVLPATRKRNYSWVLNAFEEVFKPHEYAHYWWGHFTCCSEQDHNARILALLFMAEIAGQPGGIDEQLGLV